MAANPSSAFPCRTPHRVVILLLDSVVPFDLAVPWQVFGWGREDLGAIRYQAAVCAATARPVRTSAGFHITTPYGPEVLREADTVVVAGIADLDTAIPAMICEALRAVADRGARVASTCTGAFVLAEAGLLDGRRAATHWEDATQLARRYPTVRVDPDVLYVDEGQVLTSAGIAAGVDMCLHMVRRDYGADVANAVARRLVVPPHRSGGQSQYVQHPVSAPIQGGLAATRDWMLRHISRPLTIQTLAAHAGMTRRTFTRRFRDETGSSPLHWLHHQRILLAQRLLEKTSDSMELIADQCGFGSALMLRRHFRRMLDTTPTAYRLAFRGSTRSARPPDTGS
ncbi:MAG: helix-turn-helix domain-containing protein [Longimicrobiales bacterium]